MTSQSIINADRDVLREAPRTAAATWPQPVRTFPAGEVSDDVLGDYTGW